MAFEGTSDFQPHSGVEWRGNVGQVKYGNDDLVVLFYYRPTHNPAKSKEAGRPIYDDVVYVRYHQPTERLNINDRPATEEHKRRWPLQWHQFSQNKSQVPEGTPVDVLYPEHPSIPATLRASGVHTVEQLAALEGTQVDNVGMGGQRWVNDARKFMEAANKGVKASQMRQELETRDGEIRVLKQQVDQLKEEVVRLRSNSGGLTEEQVRQIVAGAQMRPIIPANPGPAFDAATAQINAAHPTAEIAGNKRRRRA